MTERTTVNWSPTSSPDSPAHIHYTRSVVVDVNSMADSSLCTSPESRNDCHAVCSASPSDALALAHASLVGLAASRPPPSRREALILSLSGTNAEVGPLLRLN